MRFLSITSLTLFLLLHLSTHINQGYTPTETFTISCGTTGKSLDGERTWMGDTDTKYLSSNQDSTASAKATTQPSSSNQVPYGTARLSRSQFNYTFPVSAGPKFVRLFFYPASYPSFPRPDASFTVQANQFTLLNGFNASLNVDAENTETIFREYVVSVDDTQMLVLNFTASQPTSYAFINGIEVLAIPNDLYYTSANDNGFKFVGHSYLFSVLSNSALETEYRIKVGGKAISEKNDTGLFRNWEGQDEDYLMSDHASNNDLPADLINRTITVNPEYMAPKDLYRTARDMGTNGTLNKISNLTWEFPVDTGFVYMVRLHFCELDPNIVNVGYRMFYIYIASQVADIHADVMLWTNNQRGLAVHRNYAVLIPKNGTQKKVNLSIQMRPYEAWRTKYSDPFLNGLEIFKISDVGSNNLAGPNPDPVQTPQSSITNQNGKSNITVRIIAIVAAVVSGIVLISLVVFLVLFLRHRDTIKTKPKDDNKSKSSQTSKYSPLSLTMSKLTTTKSSLPSDLYRNLSLNDIKAATNNFDEVLIIGVGGFGLVYCR